MLTPPLFDLRIFSKYLDKQAYASLAMEDLHNSELIDNLVLLKFLSIETLSKIIKEEKGCNFIWLAENPTPKELSEVADRFSVFFERRSPQEIDVYVPIGNTLDDSLLQIDIPNYQFNYIYIADCNYKSLYSNLDISTLSYDLLDFRPLLVLRRLILDCNECGGTDIHFESSFIDKVPTHRIRYRIKRELEPSKFKMDKYLIQRVVQATVAKLSSASASDLDSNVGVTTDIPNLFGDGKCDLRLTGLQVSAGMYVDIAIQNTTTTTLKIDELGFPKEDVSIIRELSSRRTGLTLVTGEMRSGKNTTIFAMLNELVKYPIRIIEYSNPVENRMEFPQANYKGNIEVLKNWLRLSKKLDIDVAVLNEIPNSEVAFAVKDLVNSAIGVITTTHIDRVWHLPNKLSEFFGEDYKSILSQLNAVINQKMFRGWKLESPEKRTLENPENGFMAFAYNCGVRQYYVPTEGTGVKYRLQPLAEILIFTDEMKSKMLHFSEMYMSEHFLHNVILEQGGTIETKLAQYINEGICSLDELRKIY